MTTGAGQKRCAILLSMGGPETTADVKKYLRNIFSDRTLIRLPGGRLLQKPFARMISSLRHKKVQHHYDLIGGGSPILKWSRDQARMIEEIVGRSEPGFRCFIGMRYFRPMIDEAVRQAVEAGFERITFLPLYPQYSVATTGSSFEVARKTLAEYPKISATYIQDFHDNEEYTSLLGEYIARNVTDDETLLFSAHSLPQKFVDDGDPYVDQVKRTAALAARDREYFLSFQSRTGPVAWVGPDTIDEARRLLGEKRRLFVVPISFVCDHIETLYEIDIGLPQILGPTAEGRIRRMPMFNADPRFAALLASIIKNKVSSHV